MALLERLEPCQPFIDRDLGHIFTFIPVPIASHDDDAIVVERLSTVFGWQRKRMPV